MNARRMSLAILGAGLALVAALIGLGACRQPQPSPTPLVEQKTRTPTPPPTVTPPPLPPVVVDVRPQPGEEAPPDTAIEVVFSEPVDPASAAAGLEVLPDVPGDVAVEGPVVRFVPKAPFPRGQWVTVRVKEQVRSVTGLPLQRPIAYRFVTQTPLLVTRYSPRHGEEDIPITSTVRIAFNRPVVGVETTNEEGPPPAWLQITPPVEGRVRWVGTSLLEFKPQQPLRAGTWYTVTVAPPLTAVDGAALEKAFSFSFRTTEPRVQRVADVAFGPTAPTPVIRPDEPITVTFNLPMDPASAAGNVRLVEKATGSPVATDLAWPDQTTLVVRPTEALTLGAQYTLILETGLRTADRATTLPQPVQVPLQVVPPIHVLRTEPEDGTTDVPPGFVLVRFVLEGMVDENTLESAATVEPTPSRVFTSFSSERNQFLVQFEADARTEYTVTLKGTVGDIFGNTLGQDITVHLTTGDFPPSYQVHGPWDVSVYEAGRPVPFTVSARNIRELRVRLYRPPAKQAVDLATREAWQWQEMDASELGALVREWTLSVPPEANTWHRLDLNLTDEDDNPLGPGMYFVEVAVPDSKLEPQRRLLVVTPYNVMLKTSADEALIWVTDLRTGQPVAQVPLAVVTPHETLNVVTDGEGIARVQFTKPVDTWQPVLAVVRPGRPAGLASSAWQDGISRSAFQLQASYRRAENLVAYILTERPVYRPGQTIHWKLIARQDNDGQYALPPEGTILHLTVQDPNGEVVFEDDLALDALGTASGDLPLTESAPLGFYSFWVDGAEMLASTDVLVAAYRKPEFELHLQAEPPEVVAGDPVTVTLQARYFFGAAVSGARVEYVVYEEPYIFRWECPQPPCPPYAFSDADWWEAEGFPEPGQPIARGSGVTDENGRFVLSLNTDDVAKKGSRRWTVEMTVHDVSGQAISGRTHVVVHRAAVYPGVAPREYVAAAGERVPVDLILVDTAGNPVANAQVTFIAYRQVWYSVRQMDADGVFRWVSKVQERPVKIMTVHLDDQGRGAVTFTPPEGGSYRLRVVARDAKRREGRASAFLWASDQKYIPWRRENNDRLFLVPDKSEYRVGETARILIPSPYPGPVEALVTIERAGIRRVWRTTLQTNSDVLAIPITADMAPNVFVSVFIVQGSDAAGDELPSFKLGYTELNVNIEHQLLTVAIWPEKEEYRPRETAQITVEVRDSEGRPVDADVAVALVDKAVLTLFERPTPLAQIFYRQRGLGVSTAATLVKHAPRLLQQVEPGGKGGGGGPTGPKPTIREEFLDVAYWNPTLRPGPSGRASLSVPLPDNLTTWTLLVWAVDRETRVGQGEADILVTQDFLLQPVLPRFFTVGDQATIGVVAHNLTDSPLQSRVEVRVTGARLVDPPVQEVTIGPGERVRLDWTIADVTGERVDGRRQVTFLWQGSTNIAGVGDAVRISLPVHYPVPPDVRAAAGMVTQDTARTEVFTLPPNRAPEMGEVQLDLDASLAAGMLDSLTYLQHFPWECVEQTVSRFLPNVVTWRALQQLNVENPQLQQVLPDLVAEGIQRLMQEQNPDGGWGWWPGDESNPFLTAYALWALVEADQAGFPVSQTMMAQAAEYLFAWLSTTQPAANSWQNNRAAMALYALTQYDAKYGAQPARAFSEAVTLFEAREALDNYGKALLGLAFGTLADVASDTDQQQVALDYLNALLSDLEQTAVLDPTGAHWEESTWDWWNMNNDIRTTAIVLLLMARYDPENPLAPSAVRWLMSQRRGDRWTHTQDTAWAVVALTAWMERTGELKPDYTYTVWLNGVQSAQGKMTPANVGETVTVRAPLTSLNPTGVNWVRIERSREAGQIGSGALYYRLLLTVYPRLQEVQAVSRGLRVERWYTKGDDETPITEAQVGDIITVHVRLIAARSFTYLIVEDPLPAGTEPLDVRLLTTAREARGPSVETITEQGTRVPLGWRWWYWQPTHSELRDDRAVFFQTFLAPGTYEVTYQVRATVPGRFMVGPARAYQMYAPEVFGHTAGTTFTVRR